MIVGKKYRMCIQVGDKVLSFTGKIISIDDIFVTFIDKFGEKLNYNLRHIISFEEVKDGR